MISPAATLPQEPDTFDERIDVLARELELAIKWERPSVMLIVCGSAEARRLAQAALESGMLSLGQRIVRYPAGEARGPDLASFICRNRECANAVFFVEGLGLRAGEAPNPASAINRDRDVFVERPTRTIFWLTQNEAVDLAHYAPDFWALRHRVIEFADAPGPEKTIEGGLEFSWQGIGEYARDLDDTDAKISLRESLLTDLPEGQESTSIRANLLLTLGILNWRKGEHDKADELLREALEIATRIQDDWFEAECCNALALVRTDMGRMDEAIDAYKQAIRLAPGQIFAWNNLGNLCFRIDRNDEAIIAFQKAIEKDPRDPVSWNGLGNVYHQIGYIDDAVAAYRKSIEFAPALAHPWKGLGDVYAAIGRVSEAIAAYRKAADLNRQSPAPWLRLGELLNKQGRIRDAVEAYQTALAIDSDDGAAWNELGLLHLNAEAYAEAAAAFSKAIELDHALGWAHSNLALCCAQQEKYKEAIPFYLKSIELLRDDRDKAVSWNRLGNVYRWLNDYENAISAYKMADLLDPETSAAGRPEVPDQVEVPSAAESLPAPADAIETPAEEAPVEIPAPRTRIHWTEPDTVPGGVTMQTQPHQPESEPLSTAAETPPQEGAAEFIEVEQPQALAEDARLWNEKGNVHFKSGSFDLAIAAYNKSIELDPLFGWPYSNLGLTHLTLGNYAEAIALYQKSIELLGSDKEKAVSWNELGNAHRCLDDYNSAIQAYQQADELDPDTAGARDRFGNFHIEANSSNAQVWNDLGRLFFKTGSYEEALQAYYKAIELDPSFGWPYSNLALALVYQGDYLPAVPLYKKSIDLLTDARDRAVTWNRLGHAYRKLNDYDRANAAYRQALKLNSGNNSLVTRTRFSLLSNVTIG